MVNRIGHRLGNYRLIRRLGSGSFAEVYLGEHIFLETQAAVKVLHMQLTRDDLEDFLTESRTIANLVHPHIVRVLEFGIEGNDTEPSSYEFSTGLSVPYLVMAYASNGSLRQRHPKITRLPLDIIVFYIKQAAEALQYAHAQKLVHRDIKPENMLVGSNGEILISDFGIAWVAQSSHYQDVQEAIGTLAYMAPEQINGKPCFASDQYSLGIVAYEWLSGNRPFHGSFTEIATQHMFALPPSLHEKFPDIPPSVEEVVLTTLAKDPNQRFASVQAFASALEEASKAELPAHPRLSVMKQQPIATPALGSVHLPSAEPVVPFPAVKRSPFLSRRVILLGLAGLSVAGGGIIWRELTNASPALHPTLLAVGTTLLTYRKHSDAINAVVWSPDGKRIASASADKTVQVWDANTGSIVLTFHRHSANVFSAAWSHDSKRIASGAGYPEDTIRAWDASTGKEFYNYGGSSMIAMALSPDGTRLVSGGGDGVMQLHNAATGDQILRIHFNYEVISLAWSPQSRRVAISSGFPDHTVHVWDTASQSDVLTYIGQVNSPVAWSPAGTHLASGAAKSILVWDSATGNNLLNYRGHSSYVEAIAWSPDGRRIASGSADNTVHIWDANTGNTLYIYRGHSGSVNAVTWSPDGRQIASGGSDTIVQVWQAV